MTDSLIRTVFLKTLSKINIAIVNTIIKMMVAVIVSTKVDDFIFFNTTISKHLGQHLQTLTQHIH